MSLVPHEEDVPFTCLGARHHRATQRGRHDLTLFPPSYKWTGNRICDAPAIAPRGPGDQG